MHIGPVWDTKVLAEQGPPFGSLSLDVGINCSVQLTWLDFCCFYFILIIFFLLFLLVSFKHYS